MANDVRIERVVEGGFRDDRYSVRISVLAAELEYADSRETLRSRARPFMRWGNISVMGTIGVASLVVGIASSQVGATVAGLFLAATALMLAFTPSRFRPLDRPRDVVTRRRRARREDQTLTFDGTKLSRDGNTLQKFVGEPSFHVEAGTHPQHFRVCVHDGAQTTVLFDDLRGAEAERVVEQLTELRRRHQKARPAESHRVRVQIAPGGSETSDEMPAEPPTHAAEESAHS